MLIFCDCPKISNLNLLAKKTDGSLDWGESIQQIEKLLVFAFIELHIECLR